MCHSELLCLLELVFVLFIPCSRKITLITACASLHHYNMSSLDISQDLCSRPTSSL